MPDRLTAFALASAAATLAASCGGGGGAPVAGVVVSVPAAAAASDAAPPPATSSTPPNEGYEIYPGVSVAEAWVDCRTEDDCAIVEAGCCDHCNGGVITTVNRAFADQARTLLANVGCERPCSTNPCDRAAGHRLVCMTRACHFDDLEPEVEERIWGGRGSDDGAVEGVDGVVEGGR
jgi:hypothetical protein